MKSQKKVNVTRVTIKNDLNEVKSILSKYNLKLVYINRFYLIEMLRIF